MANLVFCYLGNEIIEFGIPIIIITGFSNFFGNLTSEYFIFTKPNRNIFFHNQLNHRRNLFMIFENNFNLEDLTEQCYFNAKIKLRDYIVQFYHNNYRATEFIEPNYSLVENINLSEFIDTFLTLDQKNQLRENTKSPMILTYFQRKLFN